MEYDLGIRFAEIWAFFDYFNEIRLLASFEGFQRKN